MPVRRVKGGYQWGTHGKIYTGKSARKKAAAQGRAAYAHGYRGKASETLSGKKGRG
jgi:hypothetical protein